MKIILPSGHECLIDDEYEYLSSWKWKMSSKGYVCCEVTKKRVFLHHIILPKMDGLFCDHINGNRADNRKSNLRYVTPKQNTWNRKRHKGGSSQYKGVRLEAGKYWRAKIRIDGVQTWLGYFETEEDAARAYDVAAKEAFGEYARLNFPS